MKLDGTVNVNTLVTAATVLVSVSLAYATLDKRIAILEQMASERSIRVEKQLEEMKLQLRELTQAVNARKDKL